MRRTIPSPLISVVAEIASNQETHASLDALFSYAGASGEPPQGSKAVKALAWLRATNKDQSTDPLDVLGRIIETYMEAELDPQNVYQEVKIRDRDRLQKTLAQCELKYLKGGHISGALGSPSKSLDDYIRGNEIGPVEQEFDRALRNVDANPREAVSAASNILESVCKIYIEQKALTAPVKQDLKSVWGVVRKELGLDASKLEDEDLQRIVSGLISIVEGIGALRTHASSAHGSGIKSYKLEPRHARLAIHSAHTVALFILESWERKADRSKD